jgi:hypothetical protein
MPTPIDPPVDWRTEPAGKRFDTVIASRLGYTDLGIGNGLVWGTKDGNEWCIAEYSTDTDAALRLPLVEGFVIEVSVYSDHSCAVNIFGDNSGYHEGCDNFDGIALAICKVWLSWMEAEENTE